MIRLDPNTAVAILEAVRLARSYDPLDIQDRGYGAGLDKDAWAFLAWVHKDIPSRSFGWVNMQTRHDEWQASLKPTEPKRRPYEISVPRSGGCFSPIDVVNRTGKVVATVRPGRVGGKDVRVWTNTTNAHSIMGALGARWSSQKCMWTASPAKAERFARLVYFEWTVGRGDTLFPPGTGRAMSGDF